MLNNKLLFVCTIVSLLLMKSIYSTEESIENPIDVIKKHFEKQEYEQAFECAQKQADQNNEAKYILSTMYFFGKGTEKDFDKALTLLEDLASKDHVKALLILVELYSNGKEIPTDYKKAYYYCEKAAQQNEPKAQVGLASLLISGAGVEKNYKQAEEWLKKAAEMDFALAQTALGVFYQEGLYVPKDIEKAKEWYKKAISNGDQNAYTALNEIYETEKLLANSKIELNKTDGEKTVSDWIELFEERIKSQNKYDDLILALEKDPSLLFQIASEIDNLETFQVYSFEQHKILVGRLYIHAAEKQYRPAIAVLPNFFFQLLDLPRAAYWEDKGVEACIPECMFFRAIRFLAGKTFDGRTEQNSEEGLKWMLIASDLNHSEAKEMIDEIDRFPKEIVEKSIQAANEWKKQNLDKLTSIPKDDF